MQRKFKQLRNVFELMLRTRSLIGQGDSNQSFNRIVPEQHLGGINLKTYLSAILNDDEKLNYTNRKIKKLKIPVLLEILERSKEIIKLKKSKREED